MNLDAINTYNSTALHAIRMAVRSSGDAGVADTADNLADSVQADHQQATGVWNRTAFRQIYPYALFNKSPLQLRRIGSLGGKAHGCPPASPPRPDANATASYPARQRPAAKHRRSRRRAGRPVSLVARRRNATLPEPVSKPAQVHLLIRL